MTVHLCRVVQHFGTPSAEEKRAFTRVLQGHIAIDTAVFPTGTTGGLAKRVLLLFADACHRLSSVGLTARHMEFAGTLRFQQGSFCSSASLGRWAW